MDINVVDKFEFIIICSFQFSWTIWLQVNHEFYFSKKYKFSISLYEELGKTKKSSIHEISNFIKFTKTGTHDISWVNGSIIFNAEYKLMRSEYQLSFSFILIVRYDLKYMTKDL